MQSLGKIRYKLKQAMFRHRKKFVAEGLAKVPSNCTWNQALPTPSGGKVRICVYGQGTPDWNQKVCDSNFGGCAQALSCKLFQDQNDPTELKDRFNRMLGLEGGLTPLSQISNSGYPDLAALLWVISEEGADDDAA